MTPGQLMVSARGRAARAVLARMDTRGELRLCGWCGEQLPANARADALYGSDACRQAASRARRGFAHGWGGAAARARRRLRAAPSTAGVTRPRRRAL